MSASTTNINVTFGKQNHFLNTWINTWILNALKKDEKSLLIKYPIYGYFKLANIYRMIWYYRTNIENKKIFRYIVVKHALTTLVVIVIEFQNVYEPEKLMWDRDDVAFLFFLLFKNSNFLISFKKDVIGEKN